MVWGVNEARHLGVEHVLLDAGARVSRLWIEYAERVSQYAEIAMDEMLAAIPGALTMRHPDACQALTGAAATPGPLRCAAFVTSNWRPGTRLRSIKRGEPRRMVKAPLVVGPTAGPRQFAARPASSFNVSGRLITRRACKSPIGRSAR